MSVEGTYGEWGPIRIAYKTSHTAKQTTIAIQSVSGSPWGEAEERTWQEKLKQKKDALPGIAPPPRKP